MIPFSCQTAFRSYQTLRAMKINPPDRLHPCETSSTTAYSSSLQDQTRSPARLRASSSAFSPIPKHTTRCRRKSTSVIHAERAHIAPTFIATCLICTQRCKPSPRFQDRLALHTGLYPFPSQEALRLFPPVPTSSTRQVPHGGNAFNAGSMYVPRLFLFRET